MKEDFLHYLWKYQKFSKEHLITSDGEAVSVLKPGTHNTESDGPDFFMSQIVIGEQRWAGNVEVHVKSSDWYAHQHQNDTAYDSVILHVVWEDDAPIYRKNNTVIPTLELKQFISSASIARYKDFFNTASKKGINCERQLHTVNDFVWTNWLEKLYIERLETKTDLVQELLKENTNNWEATCFCMLAKAFGGNTNGTAFFEMAKSIPFSIIQKETAVFRLEALFFGQLQMLDEPSSPYGLELYTEYQYLKKKYGLEPVSNGKIQFFRLRPNNFPTIRLSQLANLYIKNKNVFEKLVKNIEYKSYQDLLHTGVSEYWKTHFNFDKQSKKSPKMSSGSFKDLLIINAVIVVVFLYVKRSPNYTAIVDELFMLIRNISTEKNKVISSYNSCGKVSKNAMESQAMITLFRNYCNVRKCLKCEIFNHLINK